MSPTNGPQGTCMSQRVTFWWAFGVGFLSRGADSLGMGSGQSQTRKPPHRVNMAKGLEGKYTPHR